MIKVNEKNRSFIFLAATMIVGLIIIGFQIFVDSDDVTDVETINKQVNPNYKVLETKIGNLKNQTFNPTSYNTLISNIDDSYLKHKITFEWKVNLTSKLTTAYSNLVYSQCEFYLSGYNIHTSTEVLSWLQQLENITSQNSKIEYYRGQINAYDDYTIYLPKEVDDFYSNFDESKYNDLKNKVISMPKLDDKYKNNSKFKNIKEQNSSKLEEAYRNWAEQDNSLK